MCKKCGMQEPDSLCPNCWKIEQIQVFNDDVLICFNYGEMAAFRTFNKFKDLKVMEANI
jgi:hypothetical protein